MLKTPILAVLFSVAAFGQSAGVGSFAINGQPCTLAVAACTVSLSSVNPETATYQVLAADFSSYKTITIASGTFTITLVASGSQPANGLYINIVNYGTGVVTVARSGQNINGGTSSLTIPAASATAPNGLRVISDGANYFASSAYGGFTQTGTGAGARTQNSKNQDEVSTLDFSGAGNVVCDGTTDVSTGHLAAFSSGATRIHVPHSSSTCVTTGITIPRGVEIYGDGRAGIFSSNITTNYVSTTAAPVFAITNNAGQGTTYIHDLNIYCGLTAGSTGIEIGGVTLNAWVSNVIIENVTVDSCGTGILIQNAFEVTMHGVHVINNIGNGIYIHPPSGANGYTTSILVDGESVVASNGSGGIVMDNNNFDLVVTGKSIIQDNTTQDIKLAGTWQQATIDGNYFEGPGSLVGSAIDIANGGAVTVSNNFAINYVQFLNSSTAHTYPLLVSGNTYNQGGGGGYFATFPTGSSGFTFLGNKSTSGALNIGTSTYTALGNAIPGVVDTLITPTATSLTNTDNSAGIGLSENLFRWSNFFNNAVWTLHNMTDSTPNASADPFGGTQASAILENGTASQTYYLGYFFGSAPVATNTNVSQSVWLAADGRTSGNIEISDQAGATQECYFDLTNTVNTSCTGTWTLTTVPAGNSFFKITISGNLGTGTTAPYFAIYTTLSYFGSSTHAGTVGAGFYVYGAQLNHGLVAYPYFQSSNVAQVSAGGVSADTLQARTNLSLPALHATAGYSPLCIDSNGAVASLSCTSNVVTLLSDFTDSNASGLQAITGLSWTMVANLAQNIPFSCEILYSQATLVADTFGIQDVSVAPTRIDAGGTIYTSTTAVKFGNLANLTSTTATGIVTATPTVSTVGRASLSGVIQQPSNASSSVIQMMIQQATAADVIVVKAGSFCRIGL